MGGAHRLEPLALVLVALTMLAIVKPENVQDTSRLALTESIIHRGSLAIGGWRKQGDFSMYHGRMYTDKAPGQSFFALPVVAVSDAIPGGRPWDGTWRRWLVRVFVNGPLLLGLCIMLGRLAHELAPRTEAVVAVVAGAGTLLGPLSSVLFDHVGTAFFLFAAFVAARRRHHVLAGGAAGMAVLWEYPAVVGAALVGVYVLARGLRPAARYLLGGVPAAIVLGVYDRLAFGSPFHLSYRYVANGFADLQKGGMFGEHRPTLTSLHSVLLAGSGFRPGMGLLVTSPILIAGAAGLVLLYRRGVRADAVVCAACGVAYILWDAGYFAPYGGLSPGPRFAAPAIPFLLVGVALALQRFRLVTTAIVVASIVTSTFVALTWGTHAGWLPTEPPPTVWSLAGMSRWVGEALVLASAAAAALVAAAWLAPRRSLHVPVGTNA